MTAAQDSRALKPCPFCGGRAEFDEHDAECYFTKLRALKKSKDPVDLTPAMELIPAWNRRAALSAEPVAVPHGLLEAAQQAHDWMDSQADSQSKGNHQSFDLFCLRQERDALAKAIAAAPQPAAQERKPLSEDELFQALHSLSVEPPKRLPPGWTAFARAIERAHGITGE